MNATAGSEDGVGIVRAGARDTEGRRPRRKILFLTHRIPYPPDKGDRIRSFHLLSRLTRVGQVHLATLVHERGCGPAVDALEKMCERVLAAPVPRWGRWLNAALSLAGGKSATAGLFSSRTIREGLNRWLAEVEYDAVVCFSSGVLPYVLGRGLESRMVVDLVDVDSQKWFDYAGRAKPPLSWLFRTEGNRVRLLERAAGSSRAVVFVSLREAAVYCTFGSADRVEVIPNGVDLDHFRPVPAEEKPACVFVGQLDYRANVISMQWFCREVWPLVRARYPDALFEMVGRNPAFSLRALEAIPGVRLVGEVPDVRPWLASARLVVVPLLVARGIQNKVIEAMAMGRPVIASSQAVQGLSAVVGRDLQCADNPEAWCQAIGSLWEDGERRGALGRQGRVYTESYHNWDHWLDRFEELLPDGQQSTAALARGR
jgi:sugar transferase (PEP-CTERM/EpsH1 system associated)